MEPKYLHHLYTFRYTLGTSTHDYTLDASSNSIIWEMGPWFSALSQTLSSPPPPTKPYLITLESGANKKHNMTGCVKIEQVMNVTIKGKWYYLRSVEDRITITITREIFQTESSKINLININHTLEKLRQIKKCLEDKTNKVKRTL